MPKDHPDVGKAAACLPCHAQDPAKSAATKFSTAIHKIHQERRQSSSARLVTLCNPFKRMLIQKLLRKKHGSI
ncbi:MAG: hypothetical protein MZV70_72755 [Desulfobacterales bacterium]|nr:hypothetical protein [Desulfobacterales bacterium]